MPRKKLTLPKDFAALYIQDDLATFSAFFATTDVNATECGGSKKPALCFPEITLEQMQWLLAHGADANLRDKGGNTPLLVHARSASREQFWQDGSLAGTRPSHSLEKMTLLLAHGADVKVRDNFGDTALHEGVYNPAAIRLLLAHGADINAMNNGHSTPLHHVCYYPDIMRLLLENGADPNIRDYPSSDNPLEYALRDSIQVGHTNIANILPGVEILLHAGVSPSKKTREYVARISEIFEFCRTDPTLEYPPHTEAAIAKLCALFDVTPAPKRQMHDGHTPIKLQGATWREQYKYAWDLLIPANGHAATVQGEVIRISGRIEDEQQRNGMMNWDRDYRKMLDALPGYLQQGNALSAAQLAEIECVRKNIPRDNGTLVTRLCELAVLWVAQNPEPISLPTVAYRR